MGILTAWIMIPLGVCLGLGLGYLIGLSHGQQLRQHRKEKLACPCETV